MTIRTTWDDPLAFAERNGLDYQALRQLDFRVSHVNPIADGDTRPHCEAIMGDPGFEKLCKNLVKKNGSRYCGIHARHRREIETYGAET